MIQWEQNKLRWYELTVRQSVNSITRQVESIGDEATRARESMNKV